VNFAEIAAAATMGEAVTFYHKGHDANSRKVADRDRKREEHCSRRANALVIAWDGEGIDLFGKGRPQSYVLFGCSAEPDSPLVLDDPTAKLSHRDLCEYICDVGSRNPGAIHIGYGFAYDQNMLIQTMPLQWKERLYQGQWVKWTYKHYVYKLKIEWRKRFKVTRTRGNERHTVYIDDVVSFFHSSFVKAYEKIVGKNADPTVISGKANRGANNWTNLREIQTYWRAEILALAQLGTAFRDVLYGAGFALTDFYGPGALANYLRKREGLVTHEWGGKEGNIPSAVHSACKSAFYGGRFEQFLLGRVQGPIYSLDINSAYPYAFTHIPSLAEGYWEHVSDYRPNAFAVYRIRYADPEWINNHHGNPRRSIPAHPLPYRNGDSEISYPSVVSGWYWAPEVSALIDTVPDKLEIYEGWAWVSANELKPWKVLMERMFTERRELKRKGDITELAYKLGINSLYGKMAQRVGWNKETKSPPASHTLCIAGFVTSYCRAMIWRVVRQLPTQTLIAVETDGIYTTADPATLDLPTGIGDWLGQWELEEYSEMLYVQNGVYFARKGSEWVKAKSRGFSVTMVSPASTIEYLQSLTPGSKFQAMDIVATTSSFIGIGSALARARNGKGTISPAKASVLHCQWETSSRVLIPGGKGKRIHVPAYCDACKAGLTPYEAPHTLVSNHGAIGNIFRAVLDNETDQVKAWNEVSHSYMLPWETAKTEAWRVRAQEDDERIEHFVLGEMPGVPVQ
jgi:hypothetical protein